jgi:NADH-quinone oxidoreductase subunit L
LGALITAFYVARLWFRVFSVNRGDGGHAHEGEPVMVAPPAIMAAVTAVIGFGWWSFAGLLGEAAPPFEISVPLLSSVAVVLIGLTGGWYVFGRASAVDTAKVKAALGPLYTALSEKLYFDRVYGALLIRPYMAFTGVLSRFDGRVIDGVVNGAASGWKASSEGGWTFDIKIIDGAVNGIGWIVKAVGAQARRIQVGRLQSYQRYMFAAIVTIFVLAFAYLNVKGV